MIHTEKANVKRSGPSVARMCELLEVSRSGYYDWAARQTAGPGSRQTRLLELAGKVTAAHEDSDGVYGAPRITAELREAGEVVSVKTVAKVMRASGIQGISPRAWRPVTTLADPSPHAIPDLVGRRFDTGELNTVWTSDITYLATDEGWLYLCAVRDGCSRRVLGYAFSDSLHTDLVEEALRRAVTFRDGDTAGVILHADRGCQGGFNWSSQHPLHGGVDGQASGMDDAADGSGTDEVAGGAVASSGGGERVLAGDRQGAVGRGGCRSGRRVASRGSAMVPPRWRHVTVRPEGVLG